MGNAASKYKGAAPAADNSDNVGTEASKDVVSATASSTSADSASSEAAASNVTPIRKYAIRKDIPLVSGRAGPRLDQFGLGDLEVGDSFVIPLVTRVIKGKNHLSPESGFNVKEANKLFAPKKFMKKRTKDGIVVGRTA
jgi:hypothetical protein